MNRKMATLAGAMLSLSVLMTACTKDHDHDHDDHDHNEEELITKVILKVYQGTNVAQYKWDDADGVGGNKAVIDTIKLVPNTTYDSVKIEFSNPNEDKTPEIRKEANDHEVFYESISPLNILFSEYDTDANGYKLGLKAKWETKEATSGKVKIVLIHKPGIKALNDPITKGETDIEVEFPVIVE